MNICYGITYKLLITCLLCICLLSACSSSNNDEIDRLNDISYAFHYRDLDSTVYFARKALQLSQSYDDGKAEAYNNLAFVSIAKMDYQLATNQLDSVVSITDNQIELLIADVQSMRLCQRRSWNKDFYDYRERAMRRMNRISEGKEILTSHQIKRMVYAQSEYNIVVSTYFYYIGLKEPSIKAIDNVLLVDNIEQDTAQLLNYWYNIGSGGIITKGTKDEINQSEYDYLMRCYLTSIKYNYIYWEAQSLQGISEHIQSEHYRNKLIQDNLPGMKYLNTDNMPDSLLAGNLAQRSLDIFTNYGDVYQIAGANRTLAQCYWELNDYPSALICLENALNKDTVINRAPDLVASIREQLSLAYSAINDKPNSDFNRNLYLDIQEQTRQDRQLEARADQLSKSSQQLNLMIMAVVIMIIVVVVLLFVFDYLRRRNDRQYPFESFLIPLKEWKQINEMEICAEKERYEEIQEKTQMEQYHLSTNKRRNTELRAKISFVYSIIPFIDRIINEIKYLTTKTESSDVRQERYKYMIELIDKINQYNDILTSWIQLRKGELSLHIESFALQPLLDIVSKRRMEYQIKNITLNIEPSDAIVKADKALTLFMINTIADNSRKYTKEGSVTISTSVTDNYIEISICDTGSGMTEQQLTHIFDYKPIHDSQSVDAVSADEQVSHGFGLMNCKGIIEKYKKVSQIFSVCTIGVDSKMGQGSRFFFRLPKGVVRVLIFAITLCSSLSTTSASKSNIQDSANSNSFSYTILHKAESYADSAYFSNINGTYDKTLVWADSCLNYLNKYYLSKYPDGKDMMVAYTNHSGEPAEIRWFHDSLQTNYNIILDIRNECAVAALALHKWSLYNYNNSVYTQLFRESSADNNLTTFVRMMQKSESNKTIAVMILILLFFLIFPSYYFLYYRHRLYYRFCVDRMNSINRILLAEDEPNVKLQKIEYVWNNKKNNLNKNIPLLDHIVNEIKDALKQSIALNNAQKTNIVLAEDECVQVEMENDKLHVCNNVMENCLSTLKHETMYYPSRIKQLINGTDENLQSIKDLTDYYKQLYSILSRQAMRQMEASKPKCRICTVESIYDKPIVCDSEILLYMFELIKKSAGVKVLNMSAHDKNDKYVIITISLPDLILSDQQQTELFTPQTIDVRYFMCRQIVRDIGEVTNARGCGILAHRSDSDDGTIIEITLAKVKKHS